jgi:hypothetical protein
MKGRIHVSKLVLSIPLLVLIAGLSPTKIHAGVLFMSADTNILNPIDGSFSAPVNPDNSRFLQNVLGSGTRILIQNEYVPPETGFGTNALNTMYNGLTGVTSTTDYPGAEITSALLTNYDLFVIRPRNEFTAGEAGALVNYLNGSGNVFLIGENSSLSLAQTAVNNLLVGLGSSMTLLSVDHGSGFNTTSDIVADPFTAGVTSITYNRANAIGGGKPLYRSLDGHVIAAYQTFAPVPEPSSMTISLSAFFLVMRIRNRCRR